MNKILLLLTISTTILLVNCVKKGCTSMNSFNYDPDAQKDDGSCKYDPNYGSSGSGTLDNLSTPTFTLTANNQLVSYNTQLDTFEILREVANVGGTRYYAHGFQFKTKNANKHRLSFKFWTLGDAQDQWPTVVGNFITPGNYAFTSQVINPNTFEISYSKPGSTQRYTSLTRHQTTKVNVLDYSGFNYYGKEAIKVHLTFDAVLYKEHHIGDSVKLQNVEIIGIIQGN